MPTPLAPSLCRSFKVCSLALPLTLALSSAQAAPALLLSQQSMTSSAPCKTYGCVLLKKKTNADYETGKAVNTSYEEPTKIQGLGCFPEGRVPPVKQVFEFVERPCPDL